MVSADAHSLVCPAPLDGMCVLAGLAPAHVVLAQCDIVHDEGAKYVERVKAAGGKITVSEYAGCPHGFMTMSCWAPQFGLRVEKGEAAIKEVAQRLNAAFGSSNVTDNEI